MIGTVIQNGNTIVVYDEKRNQIKSFPACGRALKGYSASGFVTEDASTIVIYRAPDWKTKSIARGAGQYTVCGVSGDCISCASDKGRTLTQFNFEGKRLGSRPMPH